MARARTCLAFLACVVAAICGWWVTGLEPFSARATFVVLAAGLAAIAVGGAARAVASAPGIPLGSAAPWFVLVSALVAWQFAAYVQHPRFDHPTLSSLTNTALDPRPIRALAFAAWMLTAGWLARR